MADHIIDAAPRAILPTGLPKMVFYLATVEMWERYSFFLILSLLVLYMTDSVANGGLAMSKSAALSIFGAYSGLAFFSPVVGGWIAQRYMGPKKSALIGLLFMLSGHIIMALPLVMQMFAVKTVSPAASSQLYFALMLLVIGNGLFKPSIATLIPRLFSSDSPHKDKGFTVFWININVGALLASLISGPLATNFSYHVAFGSAGVGIFLALLIFRYLSGDISDEEEKPDAMVLSDTAHRQGVIWAVTMLILFAFVFFVCFGQKGGMLTLFARDMVDREIGGFVVPVTWIIGINPLIAVTLGIVTLKFWSRGTAGGRAVFPLVGALFSASIAFALLYWGIGMNSSDALSPIWMPFMIIAVLSIGDLLVWPSIYGAVARFSPKGQMQIYMGVFFGLIAVAFYTAGLVGSVAASHSLSTVLLWLAIVPGVVGLSATVISQKLVLTLNRFNER